MVSYTISRLAKDRRSRGSESIGSHAEDLPLSSRCRASTRTSMSMPWPLPQLFVRLIRAVSRRDPTRVVTAAGTVGVTALGMAGRGGGWGVAPAGQSLLLIVGGIARKPAVVDERIEPRDLLDLTVAFDHDVVDGAPAACFVQRLVDLIESGYGLEEIRQGEVRQEAPAPTQCELTSVVNRLVKAAMATSGSSSSRTPSSCRTSR
jgi:2-oxoacid dehydrogenases acyltransferase (catalytic domain)